MNRPFTDPAECEKCGSLGIEMRHIGIGGADFIACRCRRCDFEWRMESKTPRSLSADGSTIQNSEKK